MEKRIEVVEMKVGDIGNGFGNPRKISTKGKLSLQKSLEEFGDFGLILLDEKNNVIAGNQRIAIMKETDPTTKVLCKRLVGYSEAELRAINIKDNVHAGDWDMDLLAEWTADLNIDLGIDVTKEDVEQHNVKDMDLIHYEKYDYVMIVCRNEIDYNDLVRNLGIEDKKVPITNKRKIKARAIWYDNVKCKVVKKDEENQE